MRGLVLIILLLMSVNTIAAINQPHSLVEAIVKVATQPSSRVLHTSFPMIYGGQDISRSIIAIANEPLWTSKHTLIV